MRYLVLSDIHANLAALEAVLEDAGDFDAVLFLGDLIGYGPQPNECIQRVRQLPNLTYLIGNHDLAALGRADLGLFNPVARTADVWSGRQLIPDCRAFLDPADASLQMQGFALVHASPRDPVWEYMETAGQGPPNFEAFQGNFCFNGHTHVPRVFEAREENNDMQVVVWEPAAGDRINLNDGVRRIINPGGVGQPRNGDPRAAYALWESGTGTLEFRRIRYDVEVTQRKILAAGLPEVLAARLAVGL